MHAWEAIQKVIDYIEENLTQEIQMEELANIAGLSTFYFQRLFRRLVKKPIYEYIKLRRLAQALNQLKDKQIRILDIALNYGFSSHANFTRAFKETYGITPEEYRISKIHLNQFVKPELVLNYVMVDENVPLITDGIVIEIKRKRLEAPCSYIGIAREIPIAELIAGTTTGVSVTGRLWDDFHSVKSQIPHLIKGGNEFGALYIGEAKEGYCTYMAGAEAEYGVSVEGYSTFELPTAEYLICGFEAENFEELINSAVYKVQTFMERWMKKHNLTTTDFAGEMYYTSTAEHVYLEHWMMPISIFKAQ